MSIEAMKQVVKEAVYHRGGYWIIPEKEFSSFCQVIAEAEKQEQGEPVAWADHGVLNWIADMQFKHASYLYTHPQPKREWVGLTYDDMIEVWNKLYKERTDVMPLPTTFAKAIEAKLKEKNHG
jgi:hypothetical protein